MDSEIAILDGGSCDFGIESTVLKIIDCGSAEPTEEGGEEASSSFELQILRKGGVSEKSLSKTIAESESLSRFTIKVTAKKHKDFKKETE